MTQLEPGANFGRYQVVRLIGSGGMATVYEAKHVDLHKRVALKVLHPWLALRLDVVQRFVLEAQAASRFSHPHVVDIRDINSIKGVPFMEMVLLHGEPLAEVVERDGPLPVGRLVDVVLPVLSAVTAAHEAGVLHRDLKPDNIFLARVGRSRTEKPMLLDFGISKVDSGGPAQPLTAAGELLGTPAYMSPEQVLHGMPSFDARSDQYALGVVLYECSTGQLPFGNHGSGVKGQMEAISRGGAPSVSTIRADLPAAFAAVVSRAMSLDPKERFPSVLELGRALLPFAGERARALWIEEFGAESHPAGHAPPASQKARRASPISVTAAELRELALLAPLTDDEIARLPGIVPAARIAAGAAIFEQGAPASSCFVVVSGRVAVSRTYGAETWDVETVGAGAALGLAALWDDAARPVSAIASTDTVVLEIRRSVLGRLGAECPDLSRRLHDAAAATAVRRLHRAEERVARLLERPPSAAGREALVRLSAAAGEWSVTLRRSKA